MAKKRSKLLEHWKGPTDAEIIKDLRTKLDIAMKQRDDALHTLTGQANVVKTLASYGELLDTIEKSIKRFQAIANALAAFAGDRRSDLD